MRARLHIARKRSGYILQELIVGVVIFGIALVPIIRGVSRLPQLGARLGAQGRLEAWRSLTDEVVIAGIDPVATGVVTELIPTEQLEDWAPSLTRVTLAGDAASPYGAVITGLSDKFAVTAEHRGVAFGFEIGGNDGTPPPRENPLLPLPPRRLAPPIITDPASPLVRLSELVPSGQPGQPYTARIRATGADLVRLRQSAPDARESAGVGEASIEVTAFDLAQAARGEAWSEYAGDPEKDTPVSLPDLRVRWIVRVGGRMQVVEPSEIVAFVFGIDLGRPVYRLGGRDYPSGSSVEVDLALARAVERGALDAALTFPDSVGEVFGSAWSAAAPGFDWRFGAHSGDSTAGNTRTLYAASFRPLWLDSQVLHASPRSVLPGISLYGGSWTLQRRRTALAPPERAAPFYEGETDEPGQVDFKAPVVDALGSRVGRPEVGGVESTGETLSVTIIP